MYEFRGENVPAYESREREILLAGPAGTGKSVLLLTKCLTLLGKYPGCRGLFCRGTRASLTQSGLVTWEAILHAASAGAVAAGATRRVRQSYEFPNGAEFVVAGLDDPGKTLSSEYDFVYLQEATEGVTLDVYETLLRALRNGRMVKHGAPWHQIMMDVNPTTPTHWLYKRQAKGVLRMYSSTHKDNPAYWDADDWTPAGREYVEGTLKRMTGARLARFYKGVWQAAEGLVFDGYDPAKHLLAPGWLPPADWPRVWAIDWGFTNPTVLQMWAVDPDGRMYLYREFYRTRTRDEQLAKWAKELLETGAEPVPLAVVCDHDPQAKDTFEQYCPGVPVSMADKADRELGIEQAQQRFDIEGDGRPRVFIRPDLHPDGGRDDTLDAAGKPVGLVEELAGYIWNVKNPDRLKDEPLKVNDHAADSLRYACRYVDTYHAGRSADYRQHPPADPFVGVPGSHGRGGGSATGW